MIKRYFSGMWVVVSLIILAFLLAVFYFIFNSIYLLVLAILAVIVILVIPYYLGKKQKQKPGSYSLRRVK